MRELRRLAWAAAFAALAASPATAQTTAGTTVGSSGTNLGTTTTGNTTSGNAGRGNTGAQGGNNTGNTGGTTLQQMQSAPNIAPASAYTANSTNTAVNASNFLRNTYANPSYQGRYNATVAQAPGGFGTALYPQTGTTTAGGRGGQGGVGAAGSSGSVNVQDPGGIVGNLPRQIAYTSVVKFTSPAVVPTQLQSELAGMISRTTMIANPAGVQVVMTDGTNVVLRGAVRDQDEARTVEGMVRMTPGVRQITNELTYPKP